MERTFTTDKHEFTIDFVKDQATITCKSSDQNELFDNPITLAEFREMILTASIKGIKKVRVNTNYSIEVERTGWKSIGERNKVKIERISH
jgi:hypothetical protein